MVSRDVHSMTSAQYLAPLKHTFPLLLGYLVPANSDKKVDSPAPDFHNDRIEFPFFKVPFKIIQYIFLRILSIDNKYFQPDNTDIKHS